MSCLGWAETINTLDQWTLTLLVWALVLLFTSLPPSLHSSHSKTIFNEKKRKQTQLAVVSHCNLWCWCRNGCTRLAAVEWDGAVSKTVTSKPLLAPSDWGLIGVGVSACFPGIVFVPLSSCYAPTASWTATWEEQEWMRKHDLKTEKVRNKNM